MRILTEIHTSVMPAVHVRLELAHREAEMVLKALEGLEDPILVGLRTAIERAHHATKG